MFTGLIEEVGRVIVSPASGAAGRLRIDTPQLGREIEVGASVAVNGCCLTVTAREESDLAFDLLNETLARTNLGQLAPRHRVNLERAIRAGAPLGGHFVQGHIDCAVPILSVEESGADLGLEIELPAEFAHFVVEKGSIAVNGISLTVAKVLPKSFTVWIIPHTRAQTNLADAKTGDVVNLEFDILAKYVERMLDRRSGDPA